MKRKFLKFIEEKGIARKLLIYLERTGTVEISVIALRMITWLAIISIIVNLGFITNVGVVIQQGIIFSVKVFNGVMSNITYTLAYYDSKSPGTLSMLGTIISAMIGLISVLVVFYLQSVLVKKREVKNLMSLILTTYRAVNIFSISGDLQRLKKPSENKNFISKYSNLIYDKDWSKYLVNIKKYEDREILMRWLFSIEQGVHIDNDLLNTMNKDLQKIIKKYGFRLELSKVNYELKLRKKNKEKSQQQGVSTQV